MARVYQGFDAGVADMRARRAAHAFEADFAPPPARVYAAGRRRKSQIFRRRCGPATMTGRAISHKSMKFEAGAAMCSAPPRCMTSSPIHAPAPSSLRPGLFQGAIPRRWPARRAGLGRLDCRRRLMRESGPWPSSTPEQRDGRALRANAPKSRARKMGSIY